VVVGRPVGEHLGNVGVGDRLCAHLSGVEPDVDHLDRASHAAARLAHEARLGRREGHRSIGPKWPAEGHPGEPVDARGNVDRKNWSAPFDRRRFIGATQPVAACGIDHEVGGRQSRRRSERIDDLNAHTPTSQMMSIVAPVGTIVAGSGRHDDPAAIGSAEHRQRGEGHRSSGAIYQLVDPRGLGFVDLRHPRRGDDRDHEASATTVA